MPLLLKLAETALWSVVGVLLLFGSLWLFDRLDPIDFKQEIRDGNIAAGIIVGAIVVTVGAIVVAILVSPYNS